VKRALGFLFLFLFLFVALSTTANAGATDVGFVSRTSKVEGAELHYLTGGQGFIRWSARLESRRRAWSATTSA
jgi:hypothetical protein